MSWILLLGAALAAADNAIEITGQAPPYASQVCAIGAGSPCAPVDADGTFSVTVRPRQARLGLAQRVAQHNRYQLSLVFLVGDHTNAHALHAENSTFEASDRLAFTAYN